MQFKQTGIFSDIKHSLNDSDRLVAGVRVDFHEVLDSRLAANSSTAGQTDKRTLNGYFGRYESDWAGEVGTAYVGLGHVERVADYWERTRSSVAGGTTAASSSFFTNPEKTTQLDVGTSWRSGALTTSTSLFYGKVSDYILIKWANGLTVYGTAQTRNINVTTMGGEADLTYRLQESLQANATLSYVYATNDTDGVPLAQQPPLELRLGANYDDKKFLLGALWRLVAAQDRYDVGSGNIVFNGMDYGSTAGFGVFSVNGGWRPAKQSLLTIGVDNVFNQNYNEALSRGFGAAVAGYTMPSNTRISEMGRNFWLKANLEF